MINKKLHWSIIILFCLVLSALYLNSTSWFRLKLADYYKNNHQYVRAIKFYNKILTKNSLKENLQKEIFAKINFNLGYLYTKLKLRNLAIESYVRGSIKFPDIETSSYYKNDVEKDKLLAIGLLEAGRWHRAIEEFQKLSQLYPEYLEVEKYLNIAIAFKKQNVNLGIKNFYFLIGDAYIQNRLFNEARAFFTKRILDYGFQPLQVLNYLHKGYSQNLEVKEKVWGNNIYVTLEDFETFHTQLNEWINNTQAKVNNHYITEKISYDGNRSEFLDIKYNKNGYDYWIKLLNISLDKSNLPLGIRAYIKSKDQFRGYLEIRVLYAEHGGSVWQLGIKENIGDGWEMQRLGNLTGEAEAFAFAHGWDTKGMQVKIIAIDTRGISTQLYIDNIELYLEN